MKKIIVLFLLMQSFVSIKSQENWYQLGNSIPANAYSLSFAINSNNVPYVAYKENVDSPIIVKKYNNPDWVIVGNQIPSNSNYYSPYSISLAIDNNNVPYVFYPDLNNNASVRKFNGTSWEYLGNSAFSNIPDPDYLSIAIDDNNIPYVVYTSWLSVIVQKLDGNVWQTLSAISIPETAWVHSTSIAIDKNNIPYVLYAWSYDWFSGYGATVKKFNGTAWENVGNEQFSGEGSYARSSSIALNNNNIPYVVYNSDMVNNKAVVQKFNGNNWELVGIRGFSPGAAYYTSIAINNNTPYVVYSDNSNAGKATVQKYNAVNWEIVGTAGFSSSPVINPKILLSSTNIPIVAYNDNNNNIIIQYYGNQGVLSTDENNFVENKTIIYPNPVQNTFTISGNEMIEKIEIFDLLGKSVLDKKNGGADINIEFLPKGFYVAKIKTEKGTTSIKLVKE